jgi:hypothetical protein
LAKEQYRLYKLAKDQRDGGKEVLKDLLQTIEEIESRQAEIASQLFLASGQLRIDASRPGEFKSYVSECLNRIDQALQMENREVRSRFFGKTGIVTVHLTANGKIQSVVPYTSSENREFGSYLKDLVWKVPSFPQIPQLKDRRIEQVVISFTFTLEKDG